MTLKDRWYASGALRLLGAALLNGAFLALTLLLMAPGFESNDDLALAAFVDGQRAVKSACIPYINAVLALLLKGIYELLGDGAPWHTYGQYLLLFSGFTALSVTVFRRLRFTDAAIAVLVLLLFFGADAYTVVSYTKTGSVAAVGGLALMLDAADRKGKRALPLMLGGALAVFGFMLRDIEFIPCAALMAGGGLYWLLGLLGDGGLDRREKGRRFLRFAGPFLLLAAVLAGLYIGDEAAWSSGRRGEYAEFDAVRVALTDYGIPAYDTMPEQYEALGLNENAVELYRNSNFYDTEKFGRETMAALIRLRSELFPAPSPGECLGKLLDRCIPDFFRTLPVYGFLLIALLWLGAGDHRLRGWAALLYELGLFAALYMYLIYRGRYMIDHVDLGLFLAMSAVLLGTLERTRMEKERVLGGLALVCALFFSFLLCRSSFRWVESDDDDKARDRAAVETLLAHDGHIYLAKIDAVDDAVYSPFETAPAGYADRIVLMGGWDFGHPVTADTLALYGIVNPYRDIVDNPLAYIIDDDIDATLEYIRDYYDSQAHAETVEPLSTDTGLGIYRIVSGEAGA